MLNGKILHKLARRAEYEWNLARCLGFMRSFFRSLWSFVKSESALNLYDGCETVVIIGRGQRFPSSKYISSMEFDLCIFLNNVSTELVQNIPSAKKYAQQCQPAPPFARFSREKIKKLNISSLISNKTLDNYKLKRFKQLYAIKGCSIYHHPSDNEMIVACSKYDVPAPTQCGTVLKCMASTPSVKKIHLYGIDFFHSDYLTSDYHDEFLGPRHVAKINPDAKGAILIGFVRELVQDHRPDIEVYVDPVLKPAFDGYERIKYYE